MFANVAKLSYHLPMKAVDAAQPKHKQVYQALSREIQSGRLKRGDRLPSEAELVRTFGASRITVGRAVRDLQAQGLVERRAGSGTYVASRQRSWRAVVRRAAPRSRRGRHHRTGLSGHDGVAAGAQPRAHLGQPRRATAARRKSARGSCAGNTSNAACRASSSRRWSTPRRRTTSISGLRRRSTRRASRSCCSTAPSTPYPRRGHHDLVGIDNRRAGFIITEHVLRLGSQRVAFVAQPNAAATVDAREAGYREALYAFHAPVDRALIHRLDPADIAAVRQLMASARPDAIVCANDRTAGRLMQTLIKLKYAVPKDVRLVGIDDVEFAALLPVPLTTLRQPSRQIGDAALERHAGARRAAGSRGAGHPARRRIDRP